MEDEVDKNKDVHEEHEEEDQQPGFGGIINSTRCILLCNDGRIEVLSLGLFERWQSIVLCMLVYVLRSLKVRIAYPEMNKRCVQKALEQRTSGQYRKCLAHAGEQRIQFDVQVVRVRL